MLEKTEKEVKKISRIKALDKYKATLLDKVKFCDLSHQLISSKLISKDDCFEVCNAPLKKQMKLFYEKLLTIFENDSEPESKDQDPWDIFLRALKSEHPLLSCKIDSELQKLIKADKPRRLTKDDIGTPLNFKHLQHIAEKPRRFFSLRSNPSTSSSKSTGSNVNENDPDVKIFLSNVGVTKNHLRQPGTRRMILDFIEQNGGIDAIRHEIQRRSETDLKPSSTDQISQIS